MSESSVESASVWERRKLEAMSRIQRVALDLFEEHGYRAVTVERIAGVAGVSPSSVYRYFGTKEQLVLYDEYDLQLFETIRLAGGGARLEPAELITIARALAPMLITSMLTPEAELRLRQRMRFVTTIPEIRDGQTKQAREQEDDFRLLFAERTGRDPNDLGVRVAAATAIWSAMAALDHWAGSDFTRPVQEVYTETLDSIIAAIEVVFR